MEESKASAQYSDHIELQLAECARNNNDTEFCQDLIKYKEYYDSSYLELAGSNQSMPDVAE